MRTADKALMFGLPLERVLRKYEPTSLVSEGELTASSGGTLLTLNGVANTKPATWTEIVASTSVDADGFILTLQVADVGIGDMLVDVGVGAASSEATIVTNMLFTQGNSDGPPASSFVPIPIAAGSRIAMRMQSTDTSAVGARAIITLISGGVASKIKARYATTYGADTSDSGGTAVDPGGSANTKGVWSVLSADVTADFDSCIVCVGQRNNAANAAQNMLLDIGVGAALSETVLIPDLYYRVAASEEVSQKWRWVPVSVKAGQRLVARSQATGIDATDRQLDVVVIGFTGQI